VCFCHWECNGQRRKRPGLVKPSKNRRSSLPHTIERQQVLYLEVQIYSVPRNSKLRCVYLITLNPEYTCSYSDYKEYPPTLHFPFRVPCHTLQLWYTKALEFKSPKTRPTHLNSIPVFVHVNRNNPFPSGSGDHISFVSYCRDQGNQVAAVPAKPMSKAWIAQLKLQIPTFFNLLILAWLSCTSFAKAS